jgi:transposase
VAHEVQGSGEKTSFPIVLPHNSHRHIRDRISHYCILDDTGNVILEQRVPTTPKGIQQVFSKISRCRIALESGTHSPWVSQLFTQLGHEVIVAHAQKVQLITKSSRKDDRHGNGSS